MINIALGLGSNIEPEKNLKAAVVALNREFAPLKLSPVYQSQAVGFSGDDFLNMVVLGHTDLSLPELISSLKTLENKLGRVRSDKKFSSRLIDIDIVIYGDRVCQHPIELPRPELFEQAYVLRPMADVMPQQQCPGRSQTFAELWRNFAQADQPLTPVRLDFDL